MRHRDIDQLKKHEEFIATLKEELTMYDKIESLNKKIADAEALLQGARAELARLEERNKATTETVAEYMNELSIAGVFKNHSTDCLFPSHKLAHHEMFVAFGRMQEAVGELAYFQQGRDGIPGLSFKLSFGRTWDEVLAALKAKEDYIRAAMRGE